MTVPLSILQLEKTAGGICFVPELPVSKQTAVEKLAMGNVLKINLRFRERFWEAAKLWDRDAERVSFHDAGFFHYPEAPLPTWWTQLPIRAPLLVGWTGGPRADRVRSPTVREGITGRDHRRKTETRDHVDSAVILAEPFNPSQ